MSKKTGNGNGKRRYWTHEEIEKLVKMWASGKQTHEIADAVDRDIRITAAKVSTLRRQGVNLEKRGRQTIDVDALNKLVEKTA